MEMSNEGELKVRSKLTVLIPASKLTISTTWVLQTPKLEMAHHKLCFSTKLAQGALLCNVFHVMVAGFLPTATGIIRRVNKD